MSRGCASGWVLLPVQMKKKQPCMQRRFNDQPHGLTSRVMARYIDWPTEAVVGGRSGEFVGQAKTSSSSACSPTVFDAFAASTELSNGFKFVAHS